MPTKPHITKALLFLVGSSWVGHAMGQGSISFANAPVELFCLEGCESPKIAFRPTGPGFPPDVLFACHGEQANSITVLSGFANGAFSGATSIPVDDIAIDSYLGPQFAFGDLDLDGDQDAVVYWNAHDVYSPDQLFVLWWQDGQILTQEIGGPIEVEFEYAFKSKLTLFDLNDDGLLDVVLEGNEYWLWNQASQNNKDVTLLQTADHQFIDHTPSLPKDHYAVHHDMDGDGKEDLLYKAFPEPGATHFRNLGNDQFEEIAVYDSWGGSSFDWVDANNDGMADRLPPAYVSNDTTWVKAMILTNGLLDPQVFLFAVPLVSYTGFARDLNNDGSLDLVLKPGNVILAGEGDGSEFASPAMLPLTSSISWSSPPLPCDLDADGDIDLVQHGGGCITWLENLSILSTGIAGAGEPDRLAVFPSPASDHITIRAAFQEEQTAYAKIMDGLGRTMLMKPLNGRITDIDITGLCSGPYFLSIRDRTGHLLHRQPIMVVRP